MHSNILYFLLALAFVLAPWMTNSFFLRGSRLYSDIHRLVLASLVLALIFDLGWLVLVWPIFCVFGYLLYLRTESFSLSPVKMTEHLPFIFSLISSLWFVAGVLDLQMLGYNATYSFYAALHGAYLGWLFIGCLAHLSQKFDSASFYSHAAYICFLCFLLVAFGIDGVPYIKAVGTVGLSLLVPSAVLLYGFNLKKEQIVGRVLTFLSFIAILASMILALLNEFWFALPRIVFGMPMMVVAHGILNAIFAVPLFFLAIKLSTDVRSRRTSESEDIVLFDGFCVLCSRSIAWLMKLDKQAHLRYSSLQGKFAQSNLNKDAFADNDSVIFLSGDNIYKKSEALTRILKKLGGIYGFIGFALGILPFFVLDRLYDLVAQSRYRVFGKKEECSMPSDESKSRIIP